MFDQMRADLSKRLGFALDTTPFLDQLAASGADFHRAYTAMPVCAPARVSMLTGRYPSATHVRTNMNIQDAFYTDDLFDVFRHRGYRTALCGKNHSHLKPQQTDLWFECGHLGIHEPGLTGQEKAFNRFMEETHFHLSLDPCPFPVTMQLPHRITDRAMSWIESLDNGDPFLLWLSYPEPHNPYQVPQPYYSMFPPEALPPPSADESALAIKGFPYRWCRESFCKAFPGYENQIARARSNYLGMLRLLDDQVRRFTEFLEQRRLLDNTLLVILSDHGDFVGQYGLLRKGPELAEPLVRIPLIFHGPGIAPRTAAHGAFVSITDILPTLCEMTATEQPLGIQGRSLCPIWQNGSASAGDFISSYAEHGFGGLPYDGSESLEPEKDGLFVSQRGEPGAFDCLNSWTQSGALRMVRKGDWKLVFDVLGRGQMYNIAEDPAELNNVYGAPETREIQNDLQAELLKWMLQVQDPLPLPRERYVMKTRA